MAPAVSDASWPEASCGFQRESSREAKFAGQGFQCGRRVVFGVLAMAALMVVAFFAVAVGHTSGAPAVHNDLGADPVIYEERSDGSGGKAEESADEDGDPETDEDEPEDDSDDAADDDDDSERAGDGGGKKAGGGAKGKRGSKGSAASDEGECPACAPKGRQVPSVVIPFYERDLCKLKYTARSIGVNDPDKHLGTVYLMWVSTQSSSKYMDDLDGILETISKTHKVHLFDFSPLVKRSGIAGWFVQQFLKLKIASVIPSEYYIVMDAKNTIIEPIQADTFFSPCNQGKIYSKYKFDDIPMPHIQWYKASARILGVDEPEKIPVKWPASVTPVVIHRPTVLRMLAALGEGAGIDAVCAGPLCELFGVFSQVSQDQNHSTEFTLYNMYAYAKTDSECAVVAKKPEPWEAKVVHRWAVGLWRGVGGQADTMNKLNLKMLKNIQSGYVRPVMLGSQPGALDNMDEKTKAKATKIIVDLYTEHAGYDPSKSTPDELIDCVIGTEDA